MDEPSRDTSRPVATGRDSEFSLSLEEVAERYAKAGHPRTLRTLQRFCASGHLDAQKIATTTGDRYLVTPLSVERHIAQIAELALQNPVATRRDEPRQVATPVAPQISRNGEAIGGDGPRQAATGESQTPFDRDMLEREVERLEDDRNFLRDQIKVKDGQIASLLERDRETNVLIRGLQEMLTPLLGPRHEPPAQAHARDVQ
jgi:hypothetical protein